MSRRCAELGRAPSRGRRAWAVAVCAAGFLAAAASAEPLPVGLEAHGVDVRATLRSDLDVRDALNRPVSRVLVERQLAAGAAAADPSRVVSALPFARALWEAINRILFGAGLRGGRPAPAQAAAPGLPWRLPRPEPAALAAVAAAYAAVVVSLFLRPAAVAAAPAFARPHVLRC
ncbi:MAG: hypothetical protein HY553_08155 [Elusimicrobia bacterium]|nr:hypothetical protein [Elusimicrobiota bacterium]